MTHLVLTVHKYLKIHNLHICIILYILHIVISEKQQNIVMTRSQLHSVQKYWLRTPKSKRTAVKALVSTWNSVALNISSSCIENLLNQQPGKCCFFPHVGHLCLKSVNKYTACPYRTEAALCCLWWIPRYTRYFYYPR